MKRTTDVTAPLRQWGQVSGRLARRGFFPIAILWGFAWCLAFYADRIEGLCLAIILIWPVTAAAARRLHDIGRSSAWVILGLIPFAWPLLALMLIWPPTVKQTIHDRPRDDILPATAIACLGVLLSLVWVLGTPILIHRTNMKPNLLPGDIVYVWRLGGGGLRSASCWPARCPFTYAAQMQLGQVVLLRSKDGPPRAGRITALAGSTLEFSAKEIRLDGQALARAPAGIYQEFFAPSGPDRLLPRCGDRAVGLGSLCQKSAWREKLAGHSYYILDGAFTGHDMLDKAQVPGGRLFLLSDNRDTTEDSRLSPRAGGLGFVSESDTIGRAGFIIASARGTSPWAIWTWRWNRIGKKVS